MELRKELGIEEGQDVVLVREGNEIRIVSLDEAIRKVQEFFMGLGPPEVLWSETMTRDGRDEAAKGGE